MGAATKNCDYKSHCAGGVFLCPGFVAAAESILLKNFTAHIIGERLTETNQDCLFMASLCAFFKQLAPWSAVMNVVAAAFIVVLSFCALAGVDDHVHLSPFNTL